MAIALMAIGLLMVISGFRGNASQLYSLLYGDFKSGFVYWLIAILAIGFLGQVPSLKQFSTWMLVLVLLVLVLTNKQAISNFESEAGITPKS